MSAPHHTGQFKRVSRTAIHRAPALALAAAALGIGLSSFAFVSLQAGALPFFWSSSNVVYSVNAGGDPRIADGSDESAVRLAFKAWEDVSSSRVAFVEDASSAARTDWRADDLHTVRWDMTNESGFFGGAAGLVAITPVDFNPTSGQILDADILFNGKSYTFTTDLTGGTFDVQNVATHEVGHFIGLDHSAVVGATMNPFANTGDTRLRSLERDDVAAASAIYPLGATAPGVIEGFLVRNSDGRAISGAHVVAEDQDGNPCSAGLSDGNGFFRIKGLDQGSYVVYAEPLDGPVRSGNFSLSTSGLRIDTDFGTTFFGVTGGRSSPASPDRVAVSFGAVTRLSATIRALPPRSTVMNINSISFLTIEPGQSSTLTVFGSGLDGANRIDVPGSGVFLANDPSFTTSSAKVGLEVAGSALPQLRTVRVWNQTTLDCAVLTGGFEVRRAAPIVEEVTPRKVKAGDVVTVFGDRFQAGARVHVGATVVVGSVGSGRVSFTTPAIQDGVYSVAVENPDGQFAKIKSVLTVEGAAVAPASGSTTTIAGGPVAGSNTTTTAQQPTASAASAGGAATGGGGGGGGGGCALDPRAATASPVAALGLALVLLGVLRRRAAPASL